MFISTNEEKLCSKYSNKTFCIDKLESNETLFEINILFNNKYLALNETYFDKGIELLGNFMGNCIT